MPPKVIGEVAVGPVVLAAGHPPDAAFLPALHLHDVGDRVDCIGVLRVHGDRLAAQLLGALEVAALLESEGVEAEHEAEARHALVPGRQNPGHPVALVDRVAQQHVGEVGQLQGEQVARIVDQHRLPALDRRVEVALDPGPERRHVAAFPVVGLVRQLLRGVQAGHHVVVDAGLHRLGQHARLEAMAHHEVRVFP